MGSTGSGFPPRTLGLAAALLLAVGCTAEPRPRVALIGLDGADWNVMVPLMERGELPHMARLVQGGAAGPCLSYEPTMSPQVWTTIVTGKGVDEHGVDWFAVRLEDETRKGDVETEKKLIPITSRHRRVPALWDILGEAGLSVGTIGYWATWPATPVRGFMVSDRFAYSRVNRLASAREYLRFQTHPEELAAELRGAIVTPQDVSPADRARFVGGASSGGDWRRAHDILGELDITLAQTATYRNVGLELLRRGQPDFFTIYFQGIDVISHYFWEFHEPGSAGWTVPASRVQAFGDTIQEAYRRQDEILGELLAELGEDTVVIVVSDHGFRALPRDRRAVPTLSGWHRLEGIIALRGPGVVPGTILRDVDVYDVTPTVLAIMGRPTARDMPGRVLTEAFEPGFLPAPSPVASYTAMPAIPDTTPSAPMDDEMIRRLRSLGYLATEDTPSQFAPN